MKKTSLFFILVGILLAQVCGCSDSTGAPDDVPIICDEHADCPLGWYCDDGLCVPGEAPCNEDIDCPANLVCINGACTIEGTDGGQDGGFDGGDAGDGGESAPEPDIEVIDPPLTGDPPVHQINFGSVSVGVTVEQQVVLRNAGNADLRILQLNFEAGGGVDDFAIPQEQIDSLPVVVAPGGQTTFDVLYTASDGVTDHGILDIISNDPDEALVKIHLLSEFKGEPQATVAPAALDFGDVPVGDTSQPLSLTVSNQGSGNAVLQVTAIRLEVAANPDFSFSVRDATLQPVTLPQLLNTGDFLDVAVLYHPQAREADADNLVVVTDDPLNPTLTVPVTGNGAAGELAVDPTPVDLGRVRVGGHHEAIVTISNNGGAPLFVTGVSLLGASAEWTLTSSDLNLADLANNPHELQPAASATVTLGFDPVDVGVEGGQLLVDNNSSDPQISTAISAEGFIPPQVELVPDPAVLDFGNVQMDQMSGLQDSRTLPVTIRNVGGATLNISGIQLAAGTSSEYSWAPASIPPIDVGSEAPLQVTFRPDDPGAEAGILLVDSNDPDIEVDGVTGRFAVDLLARGIDPVIFVSPAASHDFSDVYLGDTEVLLVTVRNASNDPLEIRAIRLTAGSSAAYTLSALPALPQTIDNPITEVTFNVNFTPTSEGVETGAVEIVSSDIGNPTVTLMLTGSGVGCPANWADCDSDPANGCETYVASDTNNCGACGNQCTNPNGSTSCSAGVCTPACNSGFGDCDGDPDNGCEQTLTTLTHCGACSTACNLPNATETCASGTCQVQACDIGWQNCDNDHSNGCEVDTTSNINHCGACNNACTNPNGSTLCSSGTCTPFCNSGWGDCDGDPDNGCEQTLTTLTHCGACNNPCSLPNATESCAGGACQVTSCSDGWCNQDLVHSNGCEHDLDTNPACGSYISIGSVRGDTGSDQTVYSNHGEQWLRLHVAEANSDLTCVYLSASLVLQPPTGTDYDLFVYCDNCTNSAGSSSNAGSAADIVEISWDEDCFLGIPTGSESSRYVYIRVLFHSGNVCSDWSLTVYGNTAVSNRTCSTL